MLTFLRSRSRWIVAPIAGVTAAAALATVALASGSLPGDFLNAANAANAANATHRTCSTNPRPALKTSTPCGPGVAALIQREHQLAHGGKSLLPGRLPAGMSGPVQSPLSAAEQARLRNFRQLRNTFWGG
jgi:hypothetical protein